MSEVTRVEYLRARGWWQFANDKLRWHHGDHNPGTKDGISEEEAEKRQLALDNVATRYVQQQTGGSEPGR